MGTALSGAFLAGAVVAGLLMPGTLPVICEKMCIRDRNESERLMDNWHKAVGRSRGWAK